MIRPVPLLFVAMTMLVHPAAVLSQAHGGAVANDGFELSDVALFVAAAVGVWFARRSLRARFRKRRKD